MYAFVARIRSQTAPNPPRSRAASIASDMPANAVAAASRSGPSARVVGHDAAAVVHRHVEHAVREVAEVVREIGVVPLHHRLVREVAVGTEALVGHEVVAEAVDAEVGDEVGGRDLVEPASCSSSRRRRAASRARTRTAAARARRPSTSRASTPRGSAGCPCRRGGSRRATTWRSARRRSPYPTAVQ